MDARAKQVTARARAVAADLGLNYLDVDEQKEITGARWRAWADLPESRRVIAWLAEGFVVASEAAETNGIKRRHMGDASHDLATQEILARQDAEVHRRLLAGIAKMANRQD
jgi:hypothetical protein